VVALQIADPATDLLIPRVARGLPEGSRLVIVKRDQGGNSAHTALAEVVLTRPRQAGPDPLPPLPLAHSEPVHVPSPPIPAGNQGADYLIAAHGNQKGSRGCIDQALDVSEAVGSARVLTSLLSPKLQDRPRLLAAASTYRDLLAAQGGSIASAKCEMITA
jgi:hypothetical protein